MDRDPILVEREETHGSFKVNAELWYSLWTVTNDAKADIFLWPSSQQLALSMIYLKLARAIGNPIVKEHWLDIAGYAKLAAEACE